ncbi:hypothetical protein KKH82_04465 [Patescibacteria group bacterium]|nr:hypothetical protein [Patescibacteria group bacterium]
MEMNPFPQEEVFKTIKTLNKKLKEFPRIRFSFGIQSFDDEVLQQS